jgi:hypothetical protein
MDHRHEMLVHRSSSFDEVSAGRTMGIVFKMSFSGLRIAAAASVLREPFGVRTLSDN